MYVVPEWKTQSAPHSPGRHREGEVKVLSTTSGIPAEWAVSASAGRSATVMAGFPIVSTTSNRVSGRIAARMAAGSVTSANVVVTPKRGMVWVRKLRVPPYSEDEATTWLPWEVSVVTIRDRADWPDDVATAPTPPSRAAIRSSKAATVGLDIRL